MGKARFTEGPWSFAARFAASENHRGFGLFVKHGRLYLGDIMPLDEDGEEGRANAHLIAAAPDLYEALESITGEAGFEGLPESKQDAIHAALAKALGES